MSSSRSNGTLSRMSFLSVPSSSGWNGAADARKGPCAKNLPNDACPGPALGSTARGKSNTFVGIPLDGLFAPAELEYAEPTLAPNESLQTTGLMSWFASPGTNDRTTQSRFASLESFGNDEPNVTPGMAVGI